MAYNKYPLLEEYLKRQAPSADSPYIEETMDGMAMDPNMPLRQQTDLVPSEMPPLDEFGAPVFQAGGPSPVDARPPNLVGEPDPEVPVPASIPKAPSPELVDITIEGTDEPLPMGETAAPKEGSLDAAKQRASLSDLERTSGLSEAQRQRRRDLAIAQMDRGAEKLLSASSRGVYKPDFEGSKILREQAELPVTEITEQRADTKAQMSEEESRMALENSKEANDAASPLSVQTREMLERLTGRAVPSNLSANQLAKTTGLAQQIAKLEMDKKKLSLDERKLAASDKDQMSAIEKEQKKLEVKDDMQIKKENREERRKIKDAIPKFDDQVRLINDAIKAIETAKGGSDTGPIDQYIAPFTDQGQAIQQALNAVQLDKMVSMFAGMSKAIDSDAERAFFQASQPDIGKYPQTNIDILNRMLERTKQLKEKTKREADLFDRTGSFTADMQTQNEVENTSADETKSSEVKRRTKDGRTAIFNADTKQFIRYED